jgi:hypothetical protein
MQLNLKQVTAADKRERELTHTLTLLTYVVFNPRRKILEEYVPFHYV